eukprot:1703818-Rhodomonas_salina.1
MCLVPPLAASNGFADVGMKWSVCGLNLLFQPSVGGLELLHLLAQPLLLLAHLLNLNTHAIETLYASAQAVGGNIDAAHVFGGLVLELDARCRFFFFVLAVDVVVVDDVDVVVDVD